MFVKILLIAAFALRVLFSAEPAPSGSGIVETDAGGCVGMTCGNACCTSKTCCASAQQQETPRSPSPAAPRPEFQLVAIDFQTFALLHAVPAEERNFIVVDEKSGGHALPPLVTSCIQLI